MSGDGKTISVAILDPLPGRARRLAESIAGDPRFVLTASHRSLAVAYAPTEADPPEIVVIGAEMAEAPEFPMFAALVDHLGICRIMVHGGAADTRGRSSEPGVSMERILAAGGLAGFLAAERGLAAPTSARPAPVSVPAAVGTAPGRAGAGGFGSLVVIGSSTGGIEALDRMLAAFPPICPPTLIVQHIRNRFVSGMVQRLNRHCAAEVVEAEHGAAISPGRILVGPGRDEHLTIAAGGRRAHLEAGPPISGHIPSVDMLFRSAARLGPAIVGVLLTGMGRDGADGMAAIRRTGGWTIAQNRETSTVYGMPRAAVELGAVAEELPIDRIGAAVLEAAAAIERRIA